MYPNAKEDCGSIVRLRAKNKDKEDILEIYSKLFHDMTNTKLHVSVPATLLATN